ncbi:glycosyltransferase family 4 protein [bacterium]|nr:MAG: glycosyltransferase family 4 protein [bacterium]
MFPGAPIFTAIIDRKKLPPELQKADIRVSWMQRLPGVSRYFKHYLAFYPSAIESFNLSGYDIIISSSSAFAKGAIKRGRAMHVCYCHAPMRFVWNYKGYIEKERLSLVARAVLPFLLWRLKKWDVDTKDRPDYYIANSTVVKERVKNWYGKDSEVIFPPVETARFASAAISGVGDYYLIVSRLNAYKRLDLAVEAFNEAKLPLKIAGEGPYAHALKKMAGPTVEFIGRVSDANLPALYAGCRALIFPGEEDFGLTPVEANAAGRPVIAYKAGGALDTVADGVSGVFFEKQTLASLIGAIMRFERDIKSFDPVRIREHAMKFDRAVFAKKITDFIASRYFEKTGRTMQGI